MTAASVLTTSVIMNSTKPAASRADSCAGLASPKRPAISALTVDVPTSRMLRLDLEGRRDDQDDRDGLAERPAQAEHRAADDAAAAERQHHGA